MFLVMIKPVLSQVKENVCKFFENIFRKRWNIIMGNYKISNIRQMIENKKKHMCTQNLSIDMEDGLTFSYADVF